MNAAFTPEVPLASSTKPAATWKKIDWPRRIPEPFFEDTTGSSHISRWWLLRELRRTLAHEAAQAILDDDRGRGA